MHGELYIGGKGLALGYHNNPISTAKKFIENPFEPGTLIYKTGDLAVEMENGIIEYINRIDNQVKINGYRVELAEIENELNDFPGIGVDDNFFAEGGDSIKAVQIAAQLRNKGLQVTPREVLSHFSVSQLSPVVSTLEVKNPHYQELQSGSFSLTPIGSWFFNHDFENVNYYHQSVVLNFKSDIRVETLGKVMAELVRRYDGLRLNYDPKSQQLFYNDSHLGPFYIPVIKVSDEESLAMSLTFPEKTAPVSKLSDAFAGSLDNRISKSFQVY